MTPPGEGWPVHLRTHVWNPHGEGRALLLHGLGSDGLTMWRLASALADRGLRAVAPDLRGHGASPTAPDLRNASAMADVLELGDGWDVVVGHSWGGTLLAELLTRTGFARWAVLIDPVLHLPDAAAPALAAELVADVGGALTAAGIRAAHPHWDDHDVIRKLRASETIAPSTMRAAVDQNLPWDLHDRPARWQAQVHVLAADPGLGALFTPDEAATLGALPHVTITTVTGAGHSIHRDVPAAVVAAVVAAATGAATEGC